MYCAIEISESKGRLAAWAYYAILVFKAIKVCSRYCSLRSILSLLREINRHDFFVGFDPGF